MGGFQLTFLGGALLQLQCLYGRELCEPMDARKQVSLRSSLEAGCYMWIGKSQGVVQKEIANTDLTMVAFS